VYSRTREGYSRTQEVYCQTQEVYPFSSQPASCACWPLVAPVVSPPVVVDWLDLLARASSANGALAMTSVSLQFDRLIQCHVSSQRVSEWSSVSRVIHARCLPGVACSPQQVLGYWACSCCPPLACDVVAQTDEGVGCTPPAVSACSHLLPSNNIYLMGNYKPCCMVNW